MSANHTVLINELGKLNQPWNPVVCAAIKLLSQPGAMARWSPQIVEYRYAECPLVNGHWYLPNGKEPQHGPIPLGIVLDKMFEVAMHDKWLEERRERQRLIPVAMLGPGALFGAFEFFDLLTSVRLLYNYEVSAGSRSFKIARRNSVSIRTSGGQFYKSLPENMRNTWKEGATNHDALIAHYRLGKNWTAKILFFLNIPILFSVDERDFIDVISREAWKQSRPLREGHFKWLQHDFTSKKIADMDAKGVSKPLTTVISKFKRKLELAISEQCIVFGTFSDRDPMAISRYGPIGELLEKINSCGENPQKIKKKFQLRNKVHKEDILFPMFLHDSTSPCYLSLSDDALVFQDDSSKKGLTVIQQQSKQLAHIVAESCEEHCKVESVVQTGKVDPFWCGAVQLLSSFPKLPCLEAVKTNPVRSPFAGCIIVLAQHLLEETGSLIQTLLQIGGEDFAQRIFVIGKSYSSNVRVWQRIRNLGVHVEDLLYEWERGWFEDAWRNACERLWDNVKNYLEDKPNIKKILILDDGGMLHQTVPQCLVQKMAVVGVEQTSKGLKAASVCEFPVIGVACSAVKRRLEPSIIADTIWRKLQALFPQACTTQTVAVCGLGDIGGRLSRYLSNKLESKHSRLFIWDNNPETQGKFQMRGVVKARSLVEIFQEAEVIFGCAGSDVTQGIFEEIAKIQDKKTRYLISCSSYDIEFASLLRDSASRSILDITPFGFVKYEKHRGTAFLVLQGGFPVTFDRAPSAAPIELMQLTRGLLLAGLIQAAELENAASRRLPLNADAQIAVVREWRKAPMPEDRGWISEIRDQSLKWWNHSPDMEEKDFVKEYSTWPIGDKERSVDEKDALSM